MLVDATLLIQDVQLICFTVVFGVLALQRWSDMTRRWLWYSFLANAAGAVFDLLGQRLPNWINHGISLEMIPLSYALINVAFASFESKSPRTAWFSAAILLAPLPVFLAWSGRPEQFLSFALGDLIIALECAVMLVVLLRGRDASTRAPRLLMCVMLLGFVPIELARFGVAFLRHADPDAYSPGLETTSAVAYIVNVSLLPLVFIWMMHARLEAELFLQATVDPLTKVLNRRGLEQALDKELVRSARYGGDLTLAILDLDHFKQLNDVHGHAAGDAVLQEVAELLSQRLRSSDIVGRYGGEEFVLVFPQVEEAASGAILEEIGRVLRDHPFHSPQMALHVTASAGATTTRGRAVNATVLLREADIALYMAKKEGRDRVCFFDSESKGDPGRQAPGTKMVI